MHFRCLRETKISLWYLLLKLSNNSGSLFKKVAVLHNAQDRSIFWWQKFLGYFSGQIKPFVENICNCILGGWIKIYAIIHIVHTQNFSGKLKFLTSMIRTCTCARVHSIQGKPRKSGKKLWKLKNHGKPGKLRDISWKIKAFRESSEYVFALLFNLLILIQCLVHSLVIFGHITFSC